MTSCWPLRVPVPRCLVVGWQAAGYFRCPSGAALKSHLSWNAGKSVKLSLFYQVCQPSTGFCLHVGMHSQKLFIPCIWKWFNRAPGGLHFGQFALPFQNCQLSGQLLDCLPTWHFWDCGRVKSGFSVPDSPGFSVWQQSQLVSVLIVNTDKHFSF